MGYGGYSYNGGHDQGARVSREMARAHPNKPKKTVFETSQAIHVWAQQNQAYGRNAKASVFFEGPTIYSYGEHFPMASFAKPGVVLINEATYSSTTSGHQSSVRYAVNHHKTFTVKNCLAKTPAEHDANIAAIIESIEASKRILKSTRHGLYARRIAADSIEREVIRANEYQREFFPRRRKDAATLPTDLDQYRNAARVAEAKRTFNTAVNDYGRTIAGRRKESKRYSWRGGRVTPDDVRGAVVRVIKYAREYRAACKLAGADLPTFKLDWARLLRTWRAAKRSHARLESLGVYDRRSNRAASHVTITAQGQWNYTQLETLYEGHNTNRPMGYRDFDKFAREMKSPEELAKAYSAGDTARREREEQRRRVHIAMRKKELPELIEAWKAGTLESNSRLRSEAPCMLRLDGDDVETSWGARFPIEHARKAWPMIQRVYSAKLDWKRNGQQIRLGHFQIDAIATDGTVSAGCHTIKKDEILRCACMIFGPELLSKTIHIEAPKT